MVFDATMDDTRVVDLYEQVGRYRIKGDQAHKINPDGTEIPVPLPYVLGLIADHERHYRHERQDVTFSSWWWVAGFTFFFTGLLAFLFRLIAF